MAPHPGARRPVRCHRPVLHPHGYQLDLPAHTRFEGVTPIIDPDQIRQIDPTESVRLAAGAGLLDVGVPDEWAAGHAADVRHIPLGELRPHELPRDRVVVAGCRVGGRSGKAAAALAAAGVDVRNIGGGTNGWTAPGLAVTRDDGQSETGA